MPWQGGWEETKDAEDDGECLVITTDLLDKAPLAVCAAFTKSEFCVRPLKRGYAAWIRAFNEKESFASALACRRLVGDEAKEAKRQAKVLAELEAEAFAAAKEEAAREEFLRERKAKREAKERRAAAKQAEAEERWLQAHREAAAIQRAADGWRLLAHGAAVARARLFCRVVVAAAALRRAPAPRARRGRASGRRRQRLAARRAAEAARASPPSPTAWVVGGGAQTHATTATDPLEGVVVGVPAAVADETSSSERGGPDATGETDGLREADGPARGNAIKQLVGGRHRASPVHRRRARAASFITAYLLLSRTASANPPEQCATFARSINLSRDFPQATWNYRERESLIEPTPRVVRTPNASPLCLLGLAIGCCFTMPPVESVLAARKTLGIFSDKVTN